MPIPVSVSGKKLSFPMMCACCGEPPEAELSVSAVRQRGTRVVRTTTATWKFPYCRRCLYHAEAWPESIGCLAALFTLLSFGILYPLFAVLLHLKRKRVQAMCRSTCAVPFRAVSYVGWSGTVEQFQFASQPFALAFMRANRSKLVNVDYSLLPLLDAPAASSSPKVLSLSVQVPAPALPPPVQIPAPALPPPSTPSEHEVFEKIIAKIEAAKGPAGRRAAVESGLQLLTQEEMRQKLLLEASRIEVEATLEKVDQLKTPAAKRRHLQSALEELKGDRVPDELQAKQIALLEEALRELDPKEK